MVEDDTQGDGFVDRTFAHISSYRFQLDGLTFSWWATNDKPAFVSVSNASLGNRASLTESDPERAARQLALQLIREHNERARLTGANRRKHRDK